MRTNKSTRYLAFSAMLVTLAAAAPQALAALSLPVNSSVDISAENDSVTGTFITSTSSAFSYAGSFSGTLLTEIYSGDPNNTLGGLTFVYTLSNDLSSSTSLSRMTVDKWFSQPALVANNSAGSTQTYLADRNSSRIGFNFTAIGFYDGIIPGSDASFILHSEKTDYVPGKAFVIDSGTAIADTFAPIPEPSTYLAGLSALCLLGFKAVSRRK